MSKPLTRKERSIAATYRRLVKAQERASAQYELADRLSFKMAQKAGGDGQVVRISSEGKALEIIDLYQAAIKHPKRKPEQMPKAWAHGSVRQFELKETSIPIETAE